MPSLLDLSLEVLEMVLVKLDVEDVISLGSSCTHLARVVGQERIWRVLLANTQLVDEQGVVMENRMRTITTFLSAIKGQDSIFSLLHRMIYDRYPALLHDWTEEELKHMDKEVESITVSFPPSPQLHCVSLLGLQLKALAGREESRHRVHKVKMFELESPH